MMKISFTIKKISFTIKKLSFTKKLESFARTIESKGMLVKTYEPDIEITRRQILNKSWPKRELNCFKKTPGLLILDVTFDQFNPNYHNWAYLAFVSSRDNQPVLYELSDLVKHNTNFWPQIRNLIRKQKISRYIMTFDKNSNSNLSKPWIFDLTINVAKLLYNLIKAS